MYQIPSLHKCDFYRIFVIFHHVSALVRGSLPRRWFILYNCWFHFLYQQKWFSLLPSLSMQVCQWFLSQIKCSSCICEELPKLAALARQQFIHLEVNFFRACVLVYLSLPLFCPSFGLSVKVLRRFRFTRWQVCVAVKSSERQVFSENWSFSTHHPQSLSSRHAVSLLHSPAPFRHWLGCSGSRWQYPVRYIASGK